MLVCSYELGHWKCSGVIRKVAMDLGRGVIWGVVRGLFRGVFSAGV